MNFFKSLSTNQIIGLTALIIVLVLVFNFNASSEFNNSQPGQFGDIFGFSNAIFSALAFGGVLFTMAQQIKDSKSQRKVNKRNKRDNTKMIKAAKRDQFDQNFFQMLSFHASIVGSLELGKLKGRMVFHQVKDNILEWLPYEMIETGETNDPNIRSRRERNIQTTIEASKILESEYDDEFYHKYEGLLNHYYRNLYHVYKFIHSSNLISDYERKRYGALVRAQLSQDELFCIMFNTMKKDYGNPKFLFLAKEYNVLKNFRSSEVIPDVFNKLFQELVDDVEIIDLKY